jgi:phosphatidylserine/phosphatidylglycerophosphate/cardiolipin synthase-like enzyme
MAKKNNIHHLQLLLLPLLFFLAGCVGIPQRKPQVVEKFVPLKESSLSLKKPIDSEYQDLAALAWSNRVAGSMAEYVVLLERGDDALLARIHLIRSARKSIDLQTFIWRDDPTTHFVFDELRFAAARGVRVRILIDAFSKPGSLSYLARMAASHKNIQIVLYKPLSEYIEEGRFTFWDNLVFKARRMNRRMHNKLLLIDGRIGIAGGRNYENKYFDRDPRFLFRDRDVLLMGPTVQKMEESFQVFWEDKEAVFLLQLKDVQQAFKQVSHPVNNFLKQKEKSLFKEIDQQADAKSLTDFREGLKVYEADRVYFICDTPQKFNFGKNEKGFNTFFTKLLEDADHSLVYQTPYLIYDRAVRKAFQRLRKKNQRFRIIASSNSLAAADHPSAYALSFKHRKELYKKSGIDIYEAKPFPVDRTKYVYHYESLGNPGPRLCIHAKTIVIDRKKAMVGSHNFDPRSLNLNTECGVLIEDEEIAGILEDRILNACAPENAWTVSKAPSRPVISYFSGFIGGVSTALPFLDIWPYRYTTNFELKAEKEPLQPRDPDFLENYINVGYFPEVPDSATVIHARLMKAFGGWARPMM